MVWSEENLSHSTAEGFSSPIGVVIHPYKRKSQVPEVNVTDDDLPPREELPERTGRPGSPPPQTEKGKETQETPDGNGDAKEPTPTVPLHAGFDFEAIKDVLRESKDSEGGKPQLFCSAPSRNT
jgi:hypothetical protein